MRRNSKGCDNILSQSPDLSTRASFDIHKKGSSVFGWEWQSRKMTLSPFTSTALGTMLDVMWWKDGACRGGIRLHPNKVLPFLRALVLAAHNSTAEHKVEWMLPFDQDIGNGRVATFDAPVDALDQLKKLIIYFRGAPDPANQIMMREEAEILEERDLQRRLHALKK